MNRLIELREVLEAPESFSWDDTLFVAAKPWALNSACAVLNLDDLADDEEKPEFAAVNDLSYVLGIADVQDIVRNTVQQRPKSGIEDRLAALVYYCENDAFINLPE